MRREPLSNADVVDHIIRDFTTDVLGLFGREDFLTQLDFRCHAMNGLFLGTSPSGTYQLGPWNTPEQLGEYLLKALRIEGETRLAVRDGFMIYTASLLSVADQDAEFDPAIIEPLVSNLRNALLGLEGVVPFRAM